MILGMFLLAVMGFSVDLTNIWFHRQTAMAAADAACQAGAADMLAENGGMSLPAAGFAQGTASNCVSSSSATMCTYASLNGYNGTGLSSSAASNSVSWNFPATVSGVTAGAGSYPFLTVAISENVKTYIMTLLTGSRYQNINVSSTCGVTLVKEAAPMVVFKSYDLGRIYLFGRRGTRYRRWTKPRASGELVQRDRGCMERFGDDQPECRRPEWHGIRYRDCRRSHHDSNQWVIFGVQRRYDRFLEAGRSACLRSFRKRGSSDEYQEFDSE